MKFYYLEANDFAIFSLIIIFIYDVGLNNFYKLLLSYETLLKIFYAVFVTYFEANEGLANENCFERTVDAVYAVKGLLYPGYEETGLL